MIYEKTLFLVEKDRINELEEVAKNTPLFIETKPSKSKIVLSLNGPCLEIAPEDEVTEISCERIDGLPSRESYRLEYIESNRNRTMFNIRPSKDGSIPKYVRHICLYHKKETVHV